jgi:hypothetical protein
MRSTIVGLGVCAVLAMAPAVGGAAGNDCSFPGKGIGVGGTPGNPGSPGTFPGGGATGGTFPGGNCSSNGGGNVTSATEPLTLGLLALGLFGASLIRRR